MKPSVTAVAASAILAAAILFLATGCGPSTLSRSASTPRKPSSTVSNPASTASRSAMSVTIVSVKPTTLTAKHAIVTFHLRVKGMVVDTMHMGKANVRGHGHIQFYVDRVPGDAYVRKDLMHPWLAALAETTPALNLPPALLGGTGKHRIFVALAQNNYVLYRAPTASITITAT